MYGTNETRTSDPLGWSAVNHGLNKGRTGVTDNSVTSAEGTTDLTLGINMGPQKFDDRNE